MFTVIIFQKKYYLATNVYTHLSYLQIIAERLSEDEIAGLKQMFEMIDSDNSGHITLEELQIGLQKVGANLMESEISDLMEAVSSGKILLLFCFIFVQSTHVVSMVKLLTFIMYITVFILKGKKGFDRQLPLNPVITYKDAFIESRTLDLLGYCMKNRYFSNRQKDKQNLGDTLVKFVSYLAKKKKSV